MLLAPHEVCTFHVHKALPVALQSSFYTRQDVGSSPFPTSFLLPRKLSVTHSLDGDHISHINSAAAADRFSRVRLCVTP